jgi:hypothetical protein
MGQRSSVGQSHNEARSDYGRDDACADLVAGRVSALQRLLRLGGGIVTPAEILRSCKKQGIGKLEFAALQHEFDDAYLRGIGFTQNEVASLIRDGYK